MFYRMGPPGEDCAAHIKFSGRHRPGRCTQPPFAADRVPGNVCGRMVVALCDYPGCDRPLCEFHRHRHPTEADTDYCPEHAPTMMENIQKHQYRAAVVTTDRQGRREVSTPRFFSDKPLEEFGPELIRTGLYVKPGGGPIASDWIPGHCILRVWEVIGS